jgi:hypothetical protein
LNGGGLDEIERARETEAPLVVFDDTARWLCGNTHGAVVVDWDRAARDIEGAGSTSRDRMY